MKEVIILGSGFTSQYCDYRCETWGVNFTYLLARKLDKLFFTDEIEEVEKCDYPNLDRLLKLKPTLVFPTIYPKFANLGLKIQLYPIKEVRKRFHNTEFFGNSIAYMLAYSLYYEYKKIWMYGISYSYHEGIEKKEQEGTVYWMGVALGFGVEVIVPEDDSIGKTYNRKMYGEFSMTRSK